LEKKGWEENEEAKEKIKRENGEERKARKG